MNLFVVLVLAFIVQDLQEVTHRDIMIFVLKKKNPKKLQPAVQKETPANCSEKRKGHRLGRHTERAVYSTIRLQEC